MELLDLAEDGVRALVPRSSQDESRYKIRLRDDLGYGHDILLRQERSVSQSDRAAEVFLAIDDVHRFDGDRSTQRANANDLALVRVRYADVLDRGAEFDARLADLSLLGISLVTTEDLREGDRLVVMPTISGTMLRLDARVLNVTLAHFGHRRIGCETLDVRFVDQEHLVAAMSGNEPHGSAQQRVRPELPADGAVTRR